MNNLWKKLTDKIIGLGIKRKWVEHIVQFIQFGIVGLSNTAISYVVYVILVCFHFNYLFASVLGFLVSVINAFYWNNKYVFKKNKGKRTLISTFFKTFISYAGTGLVLQNILLVFWVNAFHINELFAPIINLFITVPLNFILNRFWVFNEKREK